MISTLRIGVGVGTLAKTGLGIGGVVSISVGACIVDCAGDCWARLIQEILWHRISGDRCVVLRILHDSNDPERQVANPGSSRYAARSGWQAQGAAAATA